MSTTLSKHEYNGRNCGISTVFTQTEPWNLLDLHNSDVEHLIDELQQEKHYGLLNSQDQGREFVRDDREVDDRDDRELCKWRCTIPCPEG